MILCAREDIAEKNMSVSQVGHLWASAGPDAAGPRDSSLVSLGSLMLSGFLKGLHSPKVCVGVVRADLEAMAAMFLFIYPLSFSSYFNKE